MAAAWEIFKELSLGEIRESRSYIYKNRQMFKALEDSRSSLDDLSDETKNHAYSVSNSFDRIGYVVSQGLIPESLVLDGYHYVIARSWISSEPFIVATRMARDEPSYQAYFELLAKRVFENYISHAEVKFTDETRED